MFYFMLIMGKFTNEGAVSALVAWYAFPGNRDAIENACRYCALEAPEYRS